MHMSVAVRKRPGMRMIHHDFVISALSAIESMLPHEICSSGRPIPMKLKVDSAMIALLIFMTTINMIDEAKLGVRCFHKTCQKLPPIHLAAMTYPLFRICLTSVPHTLIPFMTTPFKRSQTSCLYNFLSTHSIHLTSSVPRIIKV